LGLRRHKTRLRGFLSGPTGVREGGHRGRQAHRREFIRRSILMMEQLRGRNLAHVGCTIGLTVGLIVGILLAALLVVLLNSDNGATIATFVFFALTFGLGALGYLLGGRAAQRLDPGAPAASDEPH